MMRSHPSLLSLATLLLLALFDVGCNDAVSQDSPAVAVSTEGMVSSATPEATEAGLAMLRSGGNAVDAAVATGFALAVTLPQAGNLGGGGFMVIRFADGRSTTIDFREKAPRAATRDMFLDSNGTFLPERSQLGALAAGVPGSPAGLLFALRKYGRLPREQVLAPAITLARDGFTVPVGLNDDLRAKQSEFARFPSTAALWLREGHVPDIDSRLVQSDLASTLERIAERGEKGFYEGRTAQLIVDEMRRSGGIMTAEDLKNYSPRERTPVIGTYRGDTIVSMGPPSSGGPLLVQMLNMLEGWSFDTIPFHSARHAQLLAEVMRRAYADRAEHLGDPDFYDVPMRMLTSREYARTRAASIDPSKATPSDGVVHGDPSTWRPESPQTTHYSVIDKWGNAVSVTVTLNASFGSKLVVGGAGFFLNNEMDDFAAAPGTPNMYGLLGSEANAIAPGKRMLSSMTPTIVVRQGEPLLVVGTPGGSTIITTVLQIINDIVDYDMGLREAIEAPRLHHQWRPDTLFYEMTGLGASTLDTLRARGYTPLQRPGSSGRVDAIMVERRNGVRTYLGWSDSRGYGLAKGL